MGTGNKIKPFLLEVIDISKTSYDPIAKKIRKYLRDNNIRGKVPVICSKEQRNKFKGDIPSMIFVPATAGLLGANYVINDILNTKKLDSIINIDVKSLYDKYINFDSLLSKLNKVYLYHEIYIKSFIIDKRKVITGYKELLDSKIYYDFNNMIDIYSS